MFHFTFSNLKKQYEKALEKGYSVITCAEYAEKKEFFKNKKILVNRIDIDYSIKKAEQLGEIYRSLGIKGSFFIRLHAKEYNPFSFENYRIVKNLISDGHEIGYHSEIVDQSVIWNEDVEKCLIKDIETINRIFDIRIKGVASHGGFTGLNNLDFWKTKKPQDFGLLYEGYDQESSFNLFYESFYISDSEWTKWKCYKNGNKIENDIRSLAEHLEDNHFLIYLLIHSDTYFENHFYE